jgi:hypothetical protein
MTLIGQGRIGEAVANHPFPAIERRTDQPRDMITSRGEKQQGLADGIPALAIAIEQQAADRLGAGRTARFARRPRGNAGTPERFDQERDLGRLPGPLPAFDGDEVPAPAQCRLPQIR